MNDPLFRLVKRLKDGGHEDEAIGLIDVDFLMKAYAFTDDPLTDDAKSFAKDLRQLVASWISA
jgi:hypothetical protein